VAVADAADPSCTAESVAGQRGFRGTVTGGNNNSPPLEDTNNPRQPRWGGSDVVARGAALVQPATTESSCGRVPGSW
jgi:hypothetical protein